MLMTSFPTAAFRVQIENVGMEVTAFVGVSSLVSFPLLLCPINTDVLYDYAITRHIASGR